jgi:RNA polymerase sigma-70 factor (ECF subfamily)
MRPSSEMSAVIARARSGDLDALAALYRDHASSVMRVAYHLTASQDDAEDVVQDVFIALPEALRRLEDASAFAPWLRRIAARAALMRLRSERRRKQSPLAESTRQTSPRDERSTIADALAKLPSALRTVFVLKEIEGYSHAEIAALAGISVANSEIRLHRARLRLRAMLGD